MRNEEDKDRIPETDKRYGYDIGHWVCPRCGSVYSSKAIECSRCNPPMKYTVTC